MDTIDKIYKNNVLSKFSDEEFEFINSNIGTIGANYAPGEPNIYGTMDGKPYSEEYRFKLVIPTIKNDRITGYQPTSLLKSLENGKITKKTTDDVIRQANAGLISKKEAIFIIRARHDMIDAPYVKNKTNIFYGSGIPSETTSFSGTKMRGMLYNQSIARKVAKAMGDYEYRVLELTKKGHIKVTFSNTGTAQRLFYDEEERDKRLRWKILDSGISKLLSDSNPDTERAILNETMIFISGKNTRDPKDETIRMNGPKPNVFKYVKTKQNKDGTISIDENDLNDSAMNNLERELSVEMYSFVLEEINHKLYKWLLAPDTGIPKDLTVATSVAKEFLDAKGLLEHSGNAYKILNNVVKYGDKAIVGYKSIKSLIKMLDTIDQKTLERDPSLLLDILNGPIKPWIFMYIGGRLKQKLTQLIVDRFGAGAFMLRPTVAPTVLGILIAIDLLTITYDVVTEYRENREKLEKLIKEAEDLGFLPGPYVQTNGKIQIPLIKKKLGELTRPDGAILESFDYSIPIGVERDINGDPIPLLWKDVDPNNPTPNSPILLIDPKTKLGIPGVYVPKLIFPKKSNLPFHAFLQSTDDEKYGQNLVGLYSIDAETGIPSWSDLAEDVAQYYVTDKYQSDKSKMRSELFLRNIIENNKNGFSKAFSSTEEKIKIPPTPLVAIEGPEYRDDLPFLEKIDNLAELLNIDRDSALMVLLGFGNYSADTGTYTGLVEIVPPSDQNNPSHGFPLNSPEEVINPVAGYSN